jgi:hypothetical protein
MSCITISKPLSVDHLHRLKQRWQRGLAVEHALIVLLIAFSAFQFPFVVGATVGQLAASALARCRPCKLLWNL